MAGVEPQTREFGSLDSDGDDPIAFCIGENAKRRQMTPNEIAAARDKVMVRIRSLRADGKTTRAIADEVGVSQTKVARILAEPVESRDSTGSVRPLELSDLDGPAAPTTVAPAGAEPREAAPAPAEPSPIRVVGADGKSYPAKRIRPPADPQAARLRRLLRDLAAYTGVTTETQSAIDVLLNLLSSPSHRAD